MTYGKHKHTLIANGYIPLPIEPGKKYPLLRKWADDGFVPPNGFLNHGVGIVCGKGEYPIAGIDCDVMDAEISGKVQEYVLEKYGETIYRIGQPPKCMLVYRAEKAGLRKKQSKQYEIGRVEFCGYGEQFVAFGTHPDTKKPYYWPGILGDILDVKAKGLPILPENAVLDITEYFEQIAEAAGFEPIRKKSELQSSADFDMFDPEDPLDKIEKCGLTVERCKKIISSLDPDCGREEWRNVGMAIHYELGGSAEGLQVWDDWSSKGEKYNIGETSKQWESFGRGYVDRPITGAYLLKIEKENSAEIWEDGDFFKKLAWSTDRFINDPPPVPTIIADFLPKGVVSLFYSAGGAGKSTLILYMSIRIAIAKKHNVTFLKRSITGGKVVIVTAEDPELILNRRFMAIVKSIAAELEISVDEVREIIQDNLFIVSTFGKQSPFFKIGKDKSTLEVTKNFESLKQNLKEIKNLQMIVIDTKTRFSPGEGLGNVTATQEITHYEALTMETGASVMLLHHSNKASRDGSQTGAQAYRDATALYDSVRAAWYLRGLTEAELNAFSLTEPVPGSFLLLENSKNNYLPVCENMILYREGFNYEVKTVEPKKSKAEHKEHIERIAYDKVLDIMQVSKEVEFSQATIIRQAKELEGIGRRTVVSTLEDLIDDSLVVRKFNKKYELTEEGRNYGLFIE